jgi:hypothetical protein
MAFAICWLPIHVLELMKCTNSSLLIHLIRSYPTFLNACRAFTHALAYLNSCFNPYLYALLNRNFCIDLVAIVPSWRLCCKQSDTIEQVPSNHKRGVSFNRSVISVKHRHNDHGHEGISEYPTEQTNNDVVCQVELLAFMKNDERLCVPCRATLV